MKRRAKKSGSKGAFIGLATTAILFVLVLALMLSGTFNVSNSANEEGINATRRAIERAVVLCYATEGYYPPGLDYIESRYGVRVDTTRFAVRYEIYASNVMPVIRVVAR